LRTTNPIKSAFVTVRLRTRHEAPGSRAVGLAMVFKLLFTAEQS